MLVFIYPGELCEQHVFGSLSKQHNSPAELLNQFGGDAPAALRMQHGVAWGGWELAKKSHSSPQSVRGATGLPSHGTHLCFRAPTHGDWLTPSHCQVRGTQG